MILEVVRTCGGKRPHFVINRLLPNGEPMFYGKATGIMDHMLVDLSLQIADAAEKFRIVATESDGYRNEMRFMDGNIPLGGTRVRKKASREIILFGRSFHLPIPIRYKYTRLRFGSTIAKEYNVCLGKQQTYTLLQVLEKGEPFYVVHHDIDEEGVLKRFVCYTTEDSKGALVAVILCALRLYTTYTSGLETMPFPIKVREIPSFVAELVNKKKYIFSFMAKSKAASLRQMKAGDE